MKKTFIVVLFVILAASLVSCAAVDRNFVEISVSKNTQKPGDFGLLTPTAEQSVTYVPTFTWQLSANADSYTFELCSSENFSQKDDDTYIKKTGITSTTYTIGANLSAKETTYFWRVTAVSGGGKTAKTSSFYLDSVKGEVAFPVDYADDWSVHKEGSNATLSVEKDFFGDEQNSLKISFVQEDTKRGVDSSDGWIVVTKSVESELYGVDSFYFNFYYSGDDAEVMFRVVDDDNEYWQVPVKVARNAKQTVIAKFDEFTLRTKGGTMIANQRFDYNHIRYVELVFEKSFGDGVAVIGNIKAVNYDDYKHMFVSTLNFDEFDSQSFEYDNYTGFTTETSNDGKTLAVSFGGDIKGYGFVKIPVNKLLVGGDAFALELSFEGGTAADVLLRVIEEDGDRWSYAQSAKTIPSDGKLVIPFGAFLLSQANGDGARQFNYIKQLQIGVQGTYQSGKITISDMRVVTLAEEITDLYKGQVDENGVIDDFESYANSAEVYRVWQNSTENKDEAMTLGTQYSRKNNGQYLQLAYKTDMYPATYGVMFQSVEGYTALSFTAADMSTKSGNAAFNYLSDANAKLKVTVYVQRSETLVETFGYVVPKLASDWTVYTIAFDDFVRDESFYGDVLPFTSADVVGVMFELQYFYYTQDGKASPQYVSSQNVLLDNVKFTADTKTSSEPLVGKLKPTDDNPLLCLVDDMETLQWVDMSKQTYSSLELSDNTASGNGHSVKMGYKGNSDSVSYRYNCEFDKSVAAKAVRVRIYGDGKATVYLNIILIHANTTYKFRATLTGVEHGWHEYVVGFSNFVQVEGSGSQVLSSKLVSNITAISVGIVNSADSNESSILMDDLYLDGSVKYGTKEVIDLTKN